MECLFNIGTAGELNTVSRIHQKISRGKDFGGEWTLTTDVVLSPYQIT